MPLMSFQCPSYISCALVYLPTGVLVAPENYSSYALLVPQTMLFINSTHTGAT